MNKTIKIPQSKVTSERFNLIIRKMLDDKKAIASYFNDEITLNELQSKGIKFVKAL